MKFDGHSHTFYSKDAGTSPKVHVKTAKSLGLVMAVTDHNTTASWQKMKEYGKMYSQPVVFGEEIKIERNGKVIGELIGLFMNSEIKQGQLHEVYGSLKEQGAIIVIPHPFDTYRKPLLKNLEEKERIEIAKKADAIEGFNARCYLSSYNKTSQEFASSNSLPVTAGSDAHFPGEIGNAWIDADCTDTEELRKIIPGSKKINGKKSSYFWHFMTHATKMQKKMGLFHYDY